MNCPLWNSCLYPCTPRACGTPCRRVPVTRARVRARFSSRSISSRQMDQRQSRLDSSVVTIRHHPSLDDDRHVDYVRERNRKSRCGLILVFAIPKRLYPSFADKQSSCVCRCFLDAAGPSENEPGNNLTPFISIAFMRAGLRHSVTCSPPFVIIRCAARAKPRTVSRDYSRHIEMSSTTLKRSRTRAEREMQMKTIIDNVTAILREYALDICSENQLDARSLFSRKIVTPDRPWE